MRPLLLLLALALLLPTFPLRLPLPAADQPDAARPVAAPAMPAAPLYALPDQLVGKAEVVALRTADSATFDMGDGSYALLQNLAPLHYQAADGSRRPINPAFAATAAGWVNSTNTLRTSMEQRSSCAHVGAASVGLR
jgi:hypothetical protein